VTTSYSDVSNAAATAGAGIISSLGIGSGLNVNSIISQLMAVQNEPVTELTNRQNSDQATVSTYGLLKSALGQFQTALQGLTDTSQYQTVNATLADPTVATATATSSAAAGTYYLNVSTLAQSQTLITAGQASTNTPIGSGSTSTITFNFGTISGTATNGQYAAGATFTGAGASKTVTIDSTDNSLSGIAQAINAANIGVTASIINDGSASGNRLSLTSTSTGAANSMQISVSGDAALQSLLNEDPAGTQNLTQTSAAQNASFTLNGLAITSASNSDSTTLPGVTLNLLKTTTAPTTLTVAQDTSGTITAINSFVSAYNAVQSFISKDTSYDATTKTAGPLQGQNDVNNILIQIQSILDTPVSGASSKLANLAQVGVTFNSDGSLSADNAKLQAALTSNPNALASMFASNGSATDPLLSYKSVTSSTKPGSYQVNITQLATQGKSVGSAVAPTVIDSSNDTLNVDLNGNAQNITLTDGTYTPAQLATLLQNAINSNSSYLAAGYTATVTQNAGILTLASNKYGSNSVASITGTSALFGASATATTGLDVAGTINGQAATGTGQTLASSTGDSSGLSVNINGGSTGNRGTVNYTLGYANAVSTYIASTLGTNGAIAAGVNALNSTISDIQNSINQYKAINAQVQASLQAEYSALDVTISNMTAMGTNLTSQLASLAANSNSSS